jgi:hypothetical protein
MSNDRVFEDSQRLLELKQTRTTHEYISEFCAIVSGSSWNDAAMKFHFYQGFSNKVKDIICCEE